MTFHVGQKVVCVNAGMVGDDERTGTPWEPGGELREGVIYTVRRCYAFRGANCLWLDEIARGPGARAAHGDEVGYGAARFRPVKTTSIDIFTQMLSPVSRKTRERA